MPKPPANQTTHVSRRGEFIEVVSRSRRPRDRKRFFIRLTHTYPDGLIGLRRNYDSQLPHCVAKSRTLDGCETTTRQWWDERREHFELFISDAVLLDASGGDPDAAQRRLEVLDGIPVLSPQPEARSPKPMKSRWRKSIALLYRIAHWRMRLISPSALYTAWTICSPGTVLTLPMPRISLLLMMSVRNLATRCP